MMLHKIFMKKNCLFVIVKKKKPWFVIHIAHATHWILLKYQNISSKPGRTNVYNLVASALPSQLWVLISLCLKVEPLPIQDLLWMISVAR